MDTDYYQDEHGNYSQTGYYAGLEFRSKTEARWAIFFDEMGIEWAYEPLKIPISNGRFYIPDFYLPSNDLWVEVKGKLNTSQASKLADAMNYFPDNYMRPLADYPEFHGNLLILGSIPFCDKNETLQPQHTITDGWNVHRFSFTGQADLGFLTPNDVPIFDVDALDTWTADDFEAFREYSLGEWNSSAELGHQKSRIMKCYASASRTYLGDSQVDRHRVRPVLVGEIF